MKSNLSIEWCLRGLAETDTAWTVYSDWFPYDIKWNNSCFLGGSCVLILAKCIHGLLVSNMDKKWDTLKNSPLFSKLMYVIHNSDDTT